MKPLHPLPAQAMSAREVRAALAELRSAAALAIRRMLPSSDFGAAAWFAIGCSRGLSNSQMVCHYWRIQDWRQPWTPPLRRWYLALRILCTDAIMAGQHFAGWAYQ